MPTYGCAAVHRSREHEGLPSFHQIVGRRFPFDLLNAWHKCTAGHCGDCARVLVVLRRLPVFPAGYAF